MKHVLFKVKENMHNDWKSWCTILCEHKLIAEETMREENCVYERSVMYERDGVFYVVGTSQFNGEPKKANLDVDLNVRHKQAREDCLGGAIAIFVGEFKMPPVYEVLYEFDLR